MSKIPKESKILQVARYVEKGGLSQNQIAKTVHVSKNLVSVIATKMAESEWTEADVRAMSEDERKRIFQRKNRCIHSRITNSIVRNC